MDRNVLGVIQARMGSSRLPGKVLEDIAGRPMLWHIVTRARAADTLDDVVVATSTDSADDRVVDWCESAGVEYVRGSETDVLDRYHDAVETFDADAVVRVTADCPLIDPSVVDRVVSTYLDGDYDYVSNIERYTYPDGLDVEVIDRDALEEAWREATDSTDREHVTTYIRNGDEFETRNVENDLDVSEYGFDPEAVHSLRWTVDYQSDLEFIRAVFDRLWDESNPVFGQAAVLKVLADNPDLQKKNREIVRNEGYYRSLLDEDPVEPSEPSIENSLELKDRAEDLIPSGSQTYSKSYTQFVQGVAPVYLERADGSHTWDVDGNEYIDYPLALGPVILGHQYPAVEGAVREQCKTGVSLSLPHSLEVEVAETFRDLIPCAEMVRFGKNGSDVTSGAVRVARAFTGREVVAACGYHGWQDWYIGLKESYNDGVPEAMRENITSFEYNDIESLRAVYEEHGDDVAAVIMEPFGIEEPTDDFLANVRELTREQGSLLIFDEVLSGFRFTVGGAGQYFGVEPDLACFGKAIANGYPLSALVGRADILQEFDAGTFFSFTFGGETASLAAAQATINTLQSEPVIPHLWEQGKRLQDGYNTLAAEYGIDQYTTCTGLPPRTVMSFTKYGDSWLELKSLFQQECLKRGVLTAGYHNLSYSHTDEDIEHTLRVYRTVLEILADAIETESVSDRLEGTPVRPVFREP